MVEKVKGVPLTIDINYDLIGKIQYICGENNWNIEDSEYGENVKVHLLLELEEAEKAIQEITEATNGKAVIKKSDEGIFFKEEYRLLKSLE